ncbi:MAG TPA: hypothetical protein VF570_11280, partial [Pyrinomonadaceae bacterium]
YTFAEARRGPASQQRRPLESIHLRMRAREGHLYRFSASANGSTWIDLGEEVDGAFLPPWDRGVRVALVAGGARKAAGRFDSLRIEPSPRGGRD